MVDFTDLKEGKCFVVVKKFNKIERIQGTYSQKHQVVFACIPDYYEIMGYEQD